MVKIEYGGVDSFENNMEAGAVLQKKLNNRDRFLDFDWELDKQVGKEVCDIIFEIMEYCWPDFYGFSGKVNDTDIILSLDINDLSNDTETLRKHILEHLKHIKDIAIVPKEGYMTLELTIADVFWK